MYFFYLFFEQCIPNLVFNLKDNPIISSRRKRLSVIRNRFWATRLDWSFAGNGSVSRISPVNRGELRRSCWEERRNNAGPVGRSVWCGKFRGSCSPETQTSGRSYELFQWVYRSYSLAVSWLPWPSPICEFTLNTSSPGRLSRENSHEPLKRARQLPMQDSSQGVQNQPFLFVHLFSFSRLNHFQFLAPWSDECLLQTRCKRNKLEFNDARNAKFVLY